MVIHQSVETSFQMLIVLNVVSVIVISTCEKLGTVGLHNNGVKENCYGCVNYHTGPARLLLAMTHILIYGGSEEKTQNCFPCVFHHLKMNRR